MRIGNRFVPEEDDPPLQELEYRETGDPWRVLVACICLNRSNRNAVDRVWPVLMRRWPTARTMLLGPVPWVQDVIRPLGMHAVRAESLVRMSLQWEALDLDVRELDRSVIIDLRGCGSYAADSYEIFVRGRRDLRPTDHVLAAWLELKS